MAVTSVSPFRLASSKPSTGAVEISGFTENPGAGGLLLTLERTGPNMATLALDFGRSGDGKLTMLRQGKTLEVSGRVGGGPFSKVKLLVETAAPGVRIVTGNLAGDVGGVRLTMTTKANVTTIAGKIGAYEQSHVGTVALTVTDVEGVRTYVGKTSLRVPGEVKLTERLEGDVLHASGYISRGFASKAELIRPASTRYLELFDTNVLLLLVQAMRRQLTTV